MLDPIRDPLKDNAVVPQKYVEALERQGWVKPIRCKNCWKLGYDNCPMDDYFDSHPKEPDFFCAAGEPEEMRPRSACGPDYCEIGGGDDADAESTKSHSGRFWTKRPTKEQMANTPWEDGA